MLINCRIYKERSLPITKSPVKIAKSRTIHQDMDIDYLNLRSTNNPVTEKKLQYDKVYDNTHFNATPVIERKFYDNSTGKENHQSVNRRVSELIIPTYTNFKLDKYMDSIKSPLEDISDSNNVPKRHPTSIVVLRNGSDLATENRTVERLLVGNDHQKSLFAKCDN